MIKLIAAMKKEILLLVRDKIGLAILFLMPMVLIFVMTIIQDAVFRTITEDGIPIIFVNEDQDTLGLRIEQGLRNSEICTIQNKINGNQATRETARQAVKDGRFLIGVIIPKGATKAIRENIENIVMESIGSQDEIKVDELSVDIILIIDPVASKSFVVSISSQLREFISSVKTRLMFETFKTQITEIIPEDLDNSENIDVEHRVIRYKQEYASELTGGMRPNAVQHNVPAWTIFAMFFIVIPLVGSILKEKTEGSTFRFHTIPASYLLQINAKIFVYMCVCMLQFILMLSIGLFFLPMLGLPVLELGNSYTGILLVAFACSAAATGYGVLVAAMARTQQQGAILGSLSILVLSAIGGIWVPSYIMPETMRVISELSPLNWGIDGFYALFLRGEGLLDIIPHVIKLFVFFFVCLVMAAGINKMKKIA